MGSLSLDIYRSLNFTPYFWHSVINYMVHPALGGPQKNKKHEVKLHAT